MGKTSIEWTDESTNPFVAYLDQPPAGARTRNEGHYCEKISTGCRGCYSSGMQHRFGLPPFQEQRGRADIKHRLRADRLEYVLRKKKPTRFFWCDMTDMFGSWVPNEWIAACFGVMAATPQHTHQVLTKRAARLPEWFAWVESERLFEGAAIMTSAEVCRREAMNALPARAPFPALKDARWPLPNVHLGVSCENQETADERIPHLLRAPAAVRWVSAEPLLGPIDLGRRCFLCCGDNIDEDGYCRTCGGGGTEPRLDWVVVGSESGPRARPMDIEWARSIVDQCKAAGAAVFTKQIANANDRKGGDPQFWPAGNWPREFPR